MANFLNRARAAATGAATPAPAANPNLFRAGTPGSQLVMQSDTSLPDYVNVASDLVTISQKLSGGEYEIDIPTGAFAYRGLMLRFETGNATAITGTLHAALVDTGDNATKYVKADKIKEIIRRIKLEADGVTIWDFEDITRFIAYMKMSGCWGLGSAWFIPFGWPHVFRPGAPVQDLYALGTGNIRDLRLTVYTSGKHKTEIKPEVIAYYNPVNVPAGNVISRQVYKRSFATSGKHTIDDIRIDRRIQRILVTTDAGKKVKSYEVRIGDIEWLKSDTHINAMEALLLPNKSSDQEDVGPYRTATGALDGVGACVDLLIDQDRDGLALAPLTSDQQRRRNERIEIELDLAHSATQVTVEVYFADRL